MFETQEGKRLLKYAGVAFIILAVFLAVQTVYALKSIGYVGRDIPPNNVITVTGNGEVFAVPDVATFSFGATARAATVSAAQKQVTEKVNKAVDILKKGGIDEKDIRTSGYNIYPNYKYEQFPCSQFSCPPSTQKIDGYEVSQMITVKVRKVENAGTLLGELGSAEVTNVSGIDFTVDDEDKLKSDARKEAIAEAKEKADILVRDLGVKLGRVVNFSESGDYPIYYGKAMTLEGRGGMDMAVSSPAPEVPPGENKIVSTVTITYEIR